ncbi:putative Ntn-hydrolase superfamily protein [Brevibacterium sanguinis]|uniref:Ntn-hydrolase superfamily protein n=2 Tax=Brevibacterium TaxID=1696 RepID=A0ABX9GSM3_9MICO|nr:MULTISPECIES: DUF1028 domain-containing protein [Brevibacterium]RBP64899.1 putative Ntn-hydrolase superfamily protein [Brevibacterium sanguinis]RBP71162.1 putative Ntn-hydrolase superfamily protein [Brevibacterium celere]
MTFSLLLHDPDTGEFGAAISSSSPAVAARCLNLADGVGGANSQNVTDPRLGAAIVAEMTAGKSAQDALDSVVAQADPTAIDYRQLLVIDAHGDTAVHSGAQALGIFGARSEKNAVAGGNMLANLEVLDAFVESALSATGRIEERLFAGFTAAMAAGGEAGPVHSAGLAVVGDAGWRVTDLRVDWADEDPIGELGRLLDIWLPQRDDYITRGLDPAASPSYGVPGDDR